MSAELLAPSPCQVQSVDGWLDIPGWRGAYQLRVKIQVEQPIRVRSTDRRVTTRSGRVLHLRGQELATDAGCVALCDRGYQRIVRLERLVAMVLAAVTR